MDTGEALAVLYPNAIPDQDYILMDNGSGVQITEWNLGGSPPTQAQLEAAYLTAVKNMKIAELKVTCDSQIVAGFSSYGHSFDYEVMDQIRFLEKDVFVRDDVLVLTVDWWTRDAGVVTFSKIDFLQIVANGSAHKQTQLTNYHSKVDAVNACTTPEQVQAITW